MLPRYTKLELGGLMCNLFDDEGRKHRLASANDISNLTLYLIGAQLSFNLKP